MSLNRNYVIMIAKWRNKTFSQIIKRQMRQQNYETFTFESRYIDISHIATQIYVFCIHKSHRASVAKGINQCIVMNVIRVTQ